MAPALVVLTPHGAWAQEQGHDQEQGSDATPWRVGIGIASMERPIAGASNKTVVFPNVSYENQYVRIAGLGADLKLGSYSGLSFSVHARYALGDGYKASDAPILSGMATRDGSLWIGPGIDWKTDLAKISFEVLGDALEKSKGMQAKLGAQHDFHAGSFMITPHAAVEYVDSKYVGYYYGVTAAEATASRLEYDGKSAVNVEAGLRATYMIDPTNTLFADASAKSLGKGITDSPLVDRKVTPSFFLGYVHSF